MSHRRGRPVLVGTVALDFLHDGPLGAGLPPVTLRWGGVVNNVACALGARGTAPLFVTADYQGELRPAVAAHLAGNGVGWAPAPVRTPLPVFHAQLVDGSVAAMHFLGQEALDLLTPDLLADHVRDLLGTASALVSGTDNEAGNLAWLADVAAAKGVPFWLLSADPNEVGKLRPGGRHADLVALNHRELSLWANRSLPDRAGTVRAARELAGPSGHCVVTLGAGGALLVGPDVDDVIVHEPVRTLATGALTVGAGDVLFACLLAGRLAGLDWPAALAEAADLTTSYLAALQSDDPPYLSLRVGATESVP